MTVSMTWSSRAFVVAAVLLAGCEGGSTSYYRLMAVDDVPLPAELSGEACCHTIIDSGKVALDSDGAIHRTLHLVTYQIYSATDSLLISKTDLAYTGAYTTTVDRLVITYPDSAHISGADTAFMKHDSLIITLRPTPGIPRHLLQYRRVARECGIVTAPC